MNNISTSHIVTMKLTGNIKLVAENSDAKIASLLSIIPDFFNMVLQHSRSKQIQE